MTTIATLRRLHAAEAPTWAVSGYRVFEDNGPWLGDFLNEGPAELVIAAHNALPALLRVAEAAQEWERVTTEHVNGSADEVIAVRRAARAELRAALAALDEVQL